MGQKFSQIVVLLGILIGASGLSSAAVHYLPFLNLAEQWLGDFRIAALSPAQPQNQDIIILSVTEDTLAQFPYRSPLDRGFLSDSLRLLAERKVRAIGLDILFDQPTEPEKDRNLKTLLREMKVPLVISFADQAEGLLKAQSAYVDDFVPVELRGFPGLLKDALTGTVRWIHPGRMQADKTFISSFVSVLAAKINVPPPAGDMQIVWQSPPADKKKQTFRMFPLQTLKFLPAAWFENKVVLIGADLPMADRHRTPFAAFKGSEGILPGIVIHAHALSQLLDARAPVSVSAVKQFLIILTIAAIGIALAFIELSLIGRLGLTGISMAMILIAGFASYRYGYPLFPIIGPILAFILSLWMTDVYRGHNERAQKKFIKEAFSLYLSPALVDRVVADPDSLVLGGEFREMSYIFTDIANFTSLSERAGPEAVSRLLNDYLSGICEIAFRHGGTVTDFIGDAVFVMFNAPLNQDDHGQRALDCAQEIDDFAEQFRQQEIPKQLGLGITRIGIHSGGAAVGNMGADIHFKYSPIGDAVNTASRIEGLNKHFGTRICASAHVLQFCPHAPVRPIGHVVMKGKQEALEVFEVLGPERNQSPYTEEYRRAYAMLEDADENARELFEKLHRENPDDGCVKLHFSQISEGYLGTRIVMSEK
jgi:adenylate cyclase